MSTIQWMDLPTFLPFWCAMRSRTRAMTCVLAILLTASSRSHAAEPPKTSPDPPRGRLDTKSSRIVSAVEATVRRAGAAFHGGQFDASADAIRAAMRQVDVAMKAKTATADPAALYDALIPSMDRITNARAMLDLEGIQLPPFRKPARPEARSEPEAVAAASPMSPDSKPIFDIGPSFTRDVAPILVSKCGRCHIESGRGGFWMRTFAELMTGPPEGVVIFAGDVVGSRLIETIESGDMPRGGGRVSPEQLSTLKNWVAQGARYDGDSPEAMLTSLTVAPAANNTPRMSAAKPTGNETVDFATDIAPILVDNCSGCHIEAMQIQGGLRMDTMATLLRGGDSGSVLQPGSGETSLIVRRLRGTEGNRMPAGGRPPLSDDQIQLISTWIDEGATLAPHRVPTPLKEMARIAWIENATPDDITQRRADIALEHLRLVGGSATQIDRHIGDHFQVFGDVTPSTLQDVADALESSLDEASHLLPPELLDAGNQTGLFNGLASAYVMTRRYDYSEFARMVEQRGIPSEWESHWRTDGLSTYVAVVASEQDDPEDLQRRLVAPVASLAIASMGTDVPRWFADGIGHVIAARQEVRDRAAIAAQQAEILTAIGSLQNGKAFLDGKLPPERADRLAAAVCESLMAPARLRSLKALLGSLRSGQTFDAAFLAAMNMTPTTYFDAWLAYARR
ncbi:MAG: c-type cytochrome domain-containing protein [Planctomycetota bacterium]